MNALEHAQLTLFLQQLVQTPPPQKDVEAEALINNACNRQSDAAYLLVQRAMLLDQALQNAKDQITRLQAENTALRSQSPENNQNFVGRGWTSSPSVNTGLGEVAPIAQSAPQSSLGAGTSTFLKNAAATAAGVVAGSFLFQGIENIMGHHMGGWGGSNGLAPEVTENTIVNNYFSDTPADDFTELADNDDTSPSDWV